MEPIGIIFTCIELAQCIEDFVHRFQEARAELQEGLEIVASIRKDLSQFMEMFNDGCLPQDLVEGCFEQVSPLRDELDSIQRFLNIYVPLASRKGLAGLLWRYRWSKEIDRHQQQLSRLNQHLVRTLTALNFRFGFAALRELRGANAPADNRRENLSAIGQQYFEAAQELRNRERELYEAPNIAQIQRAYSIAANAIQGKEWARFSPSHRTLVNRVISRVV